MCIYIYIYIYIYTCIYIYIYIYTYLSLYYLSLSLSIYIIYRSAGRRAGSSAAWPTVVEFKNSPLNLLLSFYASCCFCSLLICLFSFKNSPLSWPVSSARERATLGRSKPGTLCQNFTRISSECHRIVTTSSPEFHRNFARISNWSTLKKGMTTTQPSHTVRRESLNARLLRSVFQISCLFLRPRPWQFEI